MPLRRQNSRTRCQTNPKSSNSCCSWKGAPHLVQTVYAEDRPAISEAVSALMRIHLRRPISRRSLGFVLWNDALQGFYFRPQPWTEILDRLAEKLLEELNMGTQKKASGMQGKADPALDTHDP